MISTERFAISYVNSVERKNKRFFTEKKVDIMDCVEFKGVDLVSVHVINCLLPPGIVFEIETMFCKQ